MNELASPGLELEIKALIIEALMIEDLAPDDIASEDPLFGEGLGGPGEDAVHAVPVLVPDGDFGLELVGHVVCHIAACHVAGDGRAGGEQGTGGCG